MNKLTPRWKLEHIHQKVDHQLAITENPGRTPKGYLLLDKLSQILQGIPNRKAPGFVGISGVKVLSSLDNLHTVCIQDHEATHGMPFLGSTVKLHMHSFALPRTKHAFGGKLTLPKVVLA